MNVSSRAVGKMLPELDVTITPRQCTNYAASIGDDNPLYFDDEQDGGVVAPPMLTVALTWPLSVDLSRHLEGNGLTREILDTRVHYSEYLEFHRLMRPGDRLRIRGTVVAIIPHRAGTHLIARYHAADESGRPVFTEYAGVMLRGVELLDGGSSIGLPTLPENAWEGEPEWESVMVVDPLAPYVYDGLTDIVFPIHTSPAFARRVGLPGIILQGTATLALAARELVNREAGWDPRRLRSLSCRFTAMVKPGTEIQLQLVGRRHGGELYFIVNNSRGERAVSRGHARIAEAE
jgi:acyl dehydratase